MLNKIETVLRQLDLPKEGFLITDSLITKYQDKYVELFGQAKSIKSSEISLARKLAALNLLKYKRDNNLPCQEGFIYIIGNPAWPDYYKVGMTLDTKERLNSYQTYSPHRDYKLYHYRFVLDRRKGEKQLHEVLKEFNCKGEWFNIPLLDVFTAMVDKLGR